MKFIVRYWSSSRPKDSPVADNQPHWLDYSIHPATKLGLHNALLAVHDRTEILDARGGEFECAVFLEHGNSTEKLTIEMTNSMFGTLPPGAVKWLNIGNFPLPDQASAQQLPLFEHQPTPYDDQHGPPHSFDFNA